MNIQGIEINPSLRPDFWDCPHEDRPDEEIEKWWDVPFIRVDAWEDVKPDASYDDLLYVSLEPTARAFWLRDLIFLDETNEPVGT